MPTTVHEADAIEEIAKIGLKAAKTLNEERNEGKGHSIRLTFKKVPYYRYASVSEGSS